MNKSDYMIPKNKKYNNISDKKIKKLKNLVTRILLSIILIMSVCIYIKIDDKNLKNVDTYLFQDNIEFTKINKLYETYVGKILPNKVVDNTDLVFSSNDLKSSEYEKYEDGIKIKLIKSNPISILNGGVVVFIGEKDNYNNTVIIQGNDGIDYWYGNITNVNVNLYDYLEKDTLIGEAKDDYIYLILKKDNKFINYEDYIKN